jgi:hypothetical protein
MRPDDVALTHHPSPHRARAPLPLIAFGLLGGPAAWFLQLCAGYALASTPCFHAGTRTAATIEGLEWTRGAIIVVSVIAAVVALGALALSRTLLARTREELEGGHHELMEIGTGRTRFLALWGVCFSAGAAVTIIATAFAFTVLPRCAG